MAESMSLLPEDVLVEILSRLPVKTLILLTCVCKQWLSLIRSPQFATKQLLTKESSLSRLRSRKNSIAPVEPCNSRNGTPSISFTTACSTRTGRS
ncbi:hypothetical protein Dimus_014710 [Dionaea muscipula]